MVELDVLDHDEPDRGPGGAWPLADNAASGSPPNTIVIQFGCAYDAGESGRAPGGPSSQVEFAPYQ